MQRALNILGWLGTAIVFVAVAVRFLKPEWDQYAVYAAWTGLALVVIYTLGQWREIVAYFQRRNARYAAIASVSVLVVLGLLIAVNYLSNQRNKRWDLTTNLNLFTSKINTDDTIETAGQIYSWFAKINNNFKLPNNFKIQLSGTYQSKSNLPINQGGGFMSGPPMGAQSACTQVGRPCGGRPPRQKNPRTLSVAVHDLRKR